MLFHLIKNLLNFLFLKVFSCCKFLGTTLEFWFACFIFLIGFFFVGFLFYLIFNWMKKIVYYLNLFLLLIFSIIKFYIVKFFFNLLFFLILFFYRSRFFILFGSSNFDTIHKSLLDNIFGLKNEILMNFYNFSHRYLFENRYNMPISIFQYESIFDSTKNFFFMKNFYNVFLKLVENHQKTRSYFYFLNLKKVFRSSRFYLYSSIKYSYYSLFFSFIIIIQTILVFIYKKIFKGSFDFLLIDYFLFIKFFFNHFFNQSKFFFMKFFFLKYFTILKSMFLFILVNFENDTFLAYVNIILTKLSKFNYYEEKEWETLRNTYFLYLTNSVAFQGDKKSDKYFFFKITFCYLFIYLNTCFGLLIFLILFCLKFFFYFVSFFISFIFKFKQYLWVSKIKFFLIFFFVFFFPIFFQIYYHYKLIVLNFQYFYNFFLNFFFFFKFLFFFLLIKLINFLKIFINLSLFFFSENFFHFKSFLSFKFRQLLFFKKNLILMSDLYLQNLVMSFVNSGFSFYNIDNSVKQNIVNELLKINSLNNSYFFAENINKFMLFNFRLQFLFSHFFFYNIKNFFVIFIKTNILEKIFSRFFFSKTNIGDIINVLNRNDFYEFIWKSNFFLLLLDFYFSFSIISFMYLFNSFFKFLVFFFFLILAYSKHIIKFFYLFFNRFLFFFFDIFFSFCLYIIFYIKFIFYFIFFSGFFFLFIILLVNFLIFSIVFIFKILSFLFLILIIIFFLLRLKFLFFIFSVFIWVFLIFKVIFGFFVFYLRLFSFLFKRNIGFIQILAILFTIRNDLKKYELMQSSILFNVFNIFNTEYLMNHFLNHYYKDVINSNLFNSFDNAALKTFSLNFSKQPLSIKNFKLYNSQLQKFNLLQNNFNYNYIRLKSDVFPEFEYHKYLRSRSSRNLRTFRFRKFFEPIDIFFDKNLDDISLFYLPGFTTNISSNFDFDLLKSFYKNDFFFFKDIKYFRNVFSRTNLSFFYSDLDKLSFFRFKYNKLPFLFRYFYLKRERYKYALTLYNFGNINSFSFSIISNWILNYRLLRAVVTFFIKKNKSLFVFSYRSISDFAVLSLSFFLDQFISLFNYFLFLFFFVIIFLIFFILIIFTNSYFFFGLLLFLFIFFILKIVVIFRRNSFFVYYVYRKSLSLHFFSFFFNLIRYFFFSRSVELILRSFFLNFFFFINFSIFIRFLISIFCFFIFLLLIFYFHLTMPIKDFILIFIQLNMFESITFQRVDSVFFFYMLNSNTFMYINFFFINLNILYVFFLFIIFRLFLFFVYYIILFFSRLNGNNLLSIHKFDLVFYKFFFNFFLIFFQFLIKNNSISMSLLFKELNFLINVLEKTNNFIRFYFKKN